MAAKDKIHQAVKNALIKEGWTITHDQYRIRYGDDELFADLAAEQHEKVIIVEIKSFLGRSAMQDFKEAVGQYIVYWVALRHVAPEYQLYLAISYVAYEEIFQRPVVKATIESQKIHMVVVDTKKEVIVQWIS